MVLIRPYRPGDEQGILELFALVFQSAMPIDLWRWKYQRDGDPPPIFVAEEDGRIVCHYGAIRQRFVWQGEESWGWDIVDVMGHPQYQGRGLFRRTAQAFMAEWCEGRSLLMYGFPTASHRRLGELLIGYEPVARVHTVRKTLDAAAPKYLGEDVRLDALPPDWDFHWRRLEPSFGLVGRRDHAYMTWRYLSRPGKRYRLVIVPQATALAVIGIESVHAYLMEFLVERGNPALARHLLTAVEAVARAEGAQVVEGWFPSFTWESEFLGGPGGYSRAEAENWLECRLFDRRLSAAWLAGHFYYSLSDFDVR